MPEDPNARRRAQSFWKKVKSYIAEQVGKLSEIMEVTEVRDDGRITVRTFDPDSDVTRDLPRARGLRIEVGDRVIVTSVGGHPIVTSVMRGAGGDVDDGIPFGADGTSEFAARADHIHQGRGTALHSMEIGYIAVANDRGMAIGRAARADDAAIAVGVNAKATGYISVAYGWGTNAAGAESVAIGYGAEGLQDYSIAIGRNASAYQSSVAIGRAATAGTTSLSGATAVGWGASATGLRSTAIGYNAQNARNDTAVIRSDRLVVESSSGSSNGRTGLEMKSSSGATSIMFMASGNALEIWTGSTANTIRMGDISAMFPPNYKVGSTAAPLKSYPEDGAGGVAMGVGENLYVYGTQRNGYRPCVSKNYGIGYVKSSLIVAL